MDYRELCSMHFDEMRGLGLLGDPDDLAEAADVVHAVRVDGERTGSG